MEVPQKVLNWLHRVLQPQYPDVQRTYNDTAIALGQWSTLRPSTDVFTFENGRSALLLRLAGTVPVAFRGTTYSIPVAIWVPTPYPREPPMLLVTPTQSMSVRPGQHVSGEGRVYHPYLAGWNAERSTIAEFIRIMQDVFSREPPVVATQTPPQPQSQPQPQPRQPQQQPQSAGPPVPPLPPELNRTGSARQDAGRPPSSSQPPALPPKPFQEHQATPPPSNHAPLPSSRPSLADERADAERYAHAQNSAAGQSSRYAAPPPLPPEAQQPPSTYRYPQQQQQQQQPPFSPTMQQAPQWQAAAYPPSMPPGIPQGAPPPGPAPPQQYQQQVYSHLPPQVQGQGYPAQHPMAAQPQYAPGPGAAPMPRKPTPPPDLLTDPFDPPFPTNSEPLPAPPIPPNPEKDALLQTLSATLTTRLHSALHTNDSAIPPLRAQHQALNQALGNLQREQHALQTLGASIASNTEILNQAMRDADACIARAQTASAPGVDEVFVAPTIVGQQLYELVAETQALAGARDVLGRALDRGRVGPESWVKSVRALAREEFLKRVLIEKAARGMGLQGTSEQSGHRPDGGWV